jgi:hypothetical protein
VPFVSQKRTALLLSNAGDLLCGEDVRGAVTNDRVGGSDNNLNATEVEVAISKQGISHLVIKGVDHR